MSYTEQSVQVMVQKNRKTTKLAYVPLYALCGSKNVDQVLKYFTILVKNLFVGLSMFLYKKRKPKNGIIYFL